VGVSSEQVDSGTLGRARPSSPYFSRSVFDAAHRGWQRHVHQSFLGGGLNCLYPTSHVRQGALQQQQRLQQPITLCLSVGTHVERVVTTRVDSNVTQAARSCHSSSQTAPNTQIYNSFVLSMCSGCNQIAVVSETDSWHHQEAEGVDRHLLLAAAPVLLVVCTP
jgi:hypothetical protein